MGRKLVRSRLTQRLADTFSCNIPESTHSKFVNSNPPYLSTSTVTSLCLKQLHEHTRIILPVVWRSDHGVALVVLPFTNATLARNGCLHTRTAREWPAATRIQIPDGLGGVLLRVPLTVTPSLADHTGHSSQRRTQSTSTICLHRGRHNSTT